MMSASSALGDMAAFLLRSSIELERYTLQGGCMPMTTARILALLALVLALISAVTIMPLWIAIVLLSLSVLVREGIRV
jgi:hypothetical protein